MNTRFLCKFAAAALLVTAGTLAQAASLSIVKNASSVDDPALTGNDIVGAIPGTWGANLWLDGPGTLTFEFAGSEAGWSSLFSTPGGNFLNKSTAVGTQISFEADTGWVPFTFLVTSGKTAWQSVWNGWNNAPTTNKPLFVLSELDDGRFYVGLNDDGLGRNASKILAGLIDADGDDLGVYVSVTEAPLPGTLGLLGLGLAALGMVRRRQS